jgi:alcohol dehydrogenase class IV
MAYNAELVPERFVELAEAAGCAKADPVEAAAAFVKWLVHLKGAIGIPATLAQAGVSLELLDSLSDQAFRDGCHASNPRPVSAADIRHLYERAFGVGR